MSSDLRAQAEARLTRAAAELGLADPRPPLRERLKRLREAQPDAFDRAVHHYETAVLPALTVDEPLTAWLEYGRFLGELTAAGRLLIVERTGRAIPLAVPAAALPATGTLALYVPDDAGEDVLVAALPLDPSPAQEATLALLVRRQLS
jgi:hypothetical protein